MTEHISDKTLDAMEFELLAHPHSLALSNSNVVDLIREFRSLRGLASAMEEALRVMLKIHDSKELVSMWGGAIDTVMYGCGGTREEEDAQKSIDAAIALAQAALAGKEGE